MHNNNLIGLISQGGGMSEWINKTERAEAIKLQIETITDFPFREKTCRERRALRRKTVDERHDLPA